jgi:transposase InsO family protein
LRRRPRWAKQALHLRLALPSMSRVRNPYDNAKAESFTKTLKQEEINGGRRLHYRYDLACSAAEMQRHLGSEFVGAQA